MSEDRATLPRAIVVGSGAGGAAAARELQGAYQVTILEAGGAFRPLGLSTAWMERLRSGGLLFSHRVTGLVFPPMRTRSTATQDGRRSPPMVLVNGLGTGGTTTLSTGNALRMDESLKAIGVDLDAELDQLAREVPASTDHQRSWSEPTRKLFEVSRDLGLEPRPTPKMVDYGRCRRCGRCVLGCPYGAKWDSRRFLDQAVALGAELLTGCTVRRVVIRGGRAVGVKVRFGARPAFLPADLVVLSAGGLGTPPILERSGIPCEPRLFVDPVLCVAAPLPRSRQQREIPMPFVIQRPGYIVSPYFDYLSFLFDRRWRHPADGILSLMIKLADSERGSVSDRRPRIRKRLTERDQERLEDGVAVCRRILERFGVDPASIFLGTLNAGHPGGMLPLTAEDADTMRPGRLPPNLYVADATLFPRSLGNPPILTILAIGMKVARAAMGASRAALSSAPTAVLPAAREPSPVTP